MSRWFRWYRGTTENPKFRLAARNGGVTLVTVLAVWQVLLEDAANENHRGVCVKKEDFIAAALDLDDDGTVESAFRGLEYVGLISIRIGAVTICDWGKWQYEQDVSDPTNADRQRRHRERKRTQNGSVTDRNGGVTPCNAPDTDTDTEKIPKPDGFGRDEPVGEPPQNPKQRLWGEGVPALIAMGVGEKQARPMIGRWLRDCADDAIRVLDAIQRARDHAPMDPVSWITSGLTKTKANRRTIDDRKSEVQNALGPNLYEFTAASRRSACSDGFSEGRVLVLESST